LNAPIRNGLLRLVSAAWPLLAAGCDASGHTTPIDAGTGAEAVFACSVPASAPSMGGCVMAGTSMIACNPVTNQPCASGQTCRVTLDSSQTPTSFTCVASNDAGLCTPCSDSTGPVCGGGLSCSIAVPPQSACARYCCTNDDCGDAGVCIVADSYGELLFGTLAPTLGLCGLRDAGP
jgi:hypothetical protein